MHSGLLNVLIELYKAQEYLLGNVKAIKQITSLKHIDPSAFCRCDRKQELCFTNDLSQRQGCVQQVLENDFASTDTNTSIKWKYKYK